MRELVTEELTSATNVTWAGIDFFKKFDHGKPHKNYFLLLPATSVTLKSLRKHAYGHIQYLFTKVYDYAFTTNS